MGRYYRLSKAVSEDEAKKILKELKGLRDVKKVEITEDRLCLKVETKEEAFCEVMGRAVNILKRTADGCEASFAGFLL